MSGASKPYNLVFIILDQRVDRLLAASGYALPGMEALASRGVTFANHYISSAMCTASRASFLTGQTPLVTGIIDQMQYSYVGSLSPEMPNMGSVLRALGYKTAYFGKFEMDKNILEAAPTVNYSDAIAAYGFDIFSAGGDIGSEPYSGFNNDPFIAGEAVRGLHGLAAESRRSGQPFFMVASLVNPHDIMYANANVAGQPAVQKAVVPFAAPPPPSDAIYEKTWDFTLPASVAEQLDAPGMPPALMEYKKGWDAWSGAIPTDRDDMWKIFYNYYLNAIADVDRSLAKIVAVMDEMHLWQDTVVVFTADHGEMAGAHGGIKGKGPFAYEQNIHVPLIVAHPGAKAGASCSALTSHLDLLPTFVGLTGLPDAKRPETVRALPGHDFSGLLADPESAGSSAVRPGVLFSYVGPGTVDADFLGKTMDSLFLHKPTPPLSEANLSKRGFLSVAFDGRYKLGRYYAPAACNTPRTLEEVLANNDVQIFDLQEDPEEMHNLALEPEKNRETILRMNALLNDLIAKEVGDASRLLDEAMGAAVT
ncbi:MAG: sulfatase-like hydrolase/transferase [Candidatus Eremiobacteraeota bacterium]|nr:sulfatase-like hydrolase/transferase [Candidatus Eremiobacteraeota bacterium]MBV8499971.1 sulfatase-like hydrolase/transferase [Candidatus Eremiobacteraeota bacterium]